MSKAKELAKEITDELYKFGWIDQKWEGIYSKACLERAIAAKLAQYAIFDKPTGNIPQISSWSG